MKTLICQNTRQCMPHLVTFNSSSLKIFQQLIVANNKREVIKVIPQQHTFI